MLQITPQMKILVAVEPADFRNYAVLEIMPSPQRSRRFTWSLQAF